jgi:hypothetical protein
VVAYATNRQAEAAASADPSTPVTSSSVLTPGELGTLASPAQVTALLNSLPNYPYNLAKAKAELAQPPYPHGFTTTAYTLDFGTYTPETEVAASQLAKTGGNDVPYVMLYTHTDDLAVSSKFTWPNYCHESYTSPWLFDIKQA